MDIIAAAQPEAGIVGGRPSGEAADRFRLVQMLETRQAEGPARGRDELANEIDSPTHVAGELSAEDRQRLARKRVNVLLASPAQSMRRPSILAELAWTRWHEGKVDEAASLAPIYLHVAGAPPQ
jgi:tRNA threonylcarbamoyladenosine biosynthesis protein TsaB